MSPWGEGARHALGGGERDACPYLAEEWHKRASWLAAFDEHAGRVLPAADLAILDRFMARIRAVGPVSR